MSNICRTCLGHKGRMITIFNESKTPSIQAMIMAISALEFSPNDTFSHEICNTCLETLEIAYYFREKILHSNIALQTQAQASKVLALPEVEKVEENEDYYNEQNEYISIKSEAIDNDNTPTEIDYSLEYPEFVAVDVYEPSSENQEEANLQLPLSESHDLSVESMGEDSKDIDFDETHIMYDDDDEFSSEDVSLASSSHVKDTLSEESSGSCSKSQDIQQNSDVNDGNSKAKHEFKIVSQSGNCKIPSPKRLKKKGKKHDKTKHIDENPFKCTYCNKLFKSKRALIVHIRIHTGEATINSYECEVCHKTYSWLCHLKTHMRVHTGEKPYKCQHCNMSFAMKGNLNQHMRQHVGDLRPKPHECEICPKAYSLSCNLKSHMKYSHTDEKVYKCEYCPAAFSRSNNLKRHLVKHTGEVTPKPHKCDSCDKAFSCPSLLQSHMRTHTRERPFGCQHCDERFMQAGHLKQHVKRKHPSEASTARQ